MKISFIILLALYIIISLYPIIRYWRLSTFHPKTLRRTASIIALAVALTFPISFFARIKGLDGVITNILSATGAFWCAFLLYSTIASIVAELFYLCKIIKNQKVRLYAPIVFTVILLIYGNIKYNNPTIEHYRVEILEKYGTQTTSHPFRILLVSDIHLGHSTGKAKLKKYVELINGEKPDIILIAGDIIDNNVTPVIDNKMEEELSQLKSTYGTYAVVGNHEYISGVEKSIDFISKSGITILRDSVITIQETIQIIGRDDRTNPKRKSLEDLFSDTSRDIPTLLLDHQPYALKRADSLGLDIQCYGHTHNGQMWPLNLLIEKIYEQGYGYRKWDNSHIFVSSGLSLWGPPFRIGTQSEIVVIDLF